jgi:hypothetical protein
MKNIPKTSLFLLLLFLVFFAGCSSNEKKQAGEAVDGAFIAEESRILPLYLIYTPKGKDALEQRQNRQNFETANIIQQASLYFPTRFTRSEKEWSDIAEAQVSHSIKSFNDLGANVFEYQVEVTGIAANPGPGKRYAVNFSLSDLSNNSRVRQPAVYALEKASILSGINSGYARLEFLRYSSGSKTFQGSVIITAK